MKTKKYLYKKIKNPYYSIITVVKMMKKIFAKQFKV